MNAIVILLAVSSLLGLVLGFYFSWLAIGVSGSVVAFLSAIVLQHEGFGSLAGIAITVACVLCKTAHYSNEKPPVFATCRAHVALIFLVPEANETYRVNGRARVSVDPVLKRRFAVDGKEPTTVIVVAVEQAFQHCPKALVRSDLWKAGRGDRPKGVPTLGDFAAARAPGTDSSAYDADYARRMPNELY